MALYVAAAFFAGDLFVFFIRKNQFFKCVPAFTAPEGQQRHLPSLPRRRSPTAPLVQRDQWQQKIVTTL
jgi:hypothetical protein